MIYPWPGAFWVAFGQESLCNWVTTACTRYRFRGSWSLLLVPCPFGSGICDYHAPRSDQLLILQSYEKQTEQIDRQRKDTSIGMQNTEKAKPAGLCRRYKNWRERTHDEHFTMAAYVVVWNGGPKKKNMSLLNTRFAIIQTRAFLHWVGVIGAKMSGRWVASLRRQIHSWNVEGWTLINLTEFCVRCPG